MSATDPKKSKPRRRARPEEPLVIHPDDVQATLDRLMGPKLKAEPEPGEKPKEKSKDDKRPPKRKS